MRLQSIAALIFLTISCTSAQPSSVTTVPYVELERYIGTWYEISSYPQWFEKGMSNVKAEYSQQDGYIKVENSGIKNGKLKVSKGRAKVVADSGNAKLRVSFFRPFWGDYWIVDLDTDYQWVAISNSDRSTLWVLARTPKMDPTTYQKVLDRLAKADFDLTKLVMMQQLDNQ